MFTWYGFAKMTGLGTGLDCLGHRRNNRSFLPAGWDGTPATIMGSSQLFVPCWPSWGDAVLFVFTELNHLVGDSLQEVEKSQLEYARAAVTNVTDEDFRIFSARDMADDNGKLDTNRVTATAIEKFKTEELPDLRKLASGQTGQSRGLSQLLASFLAPALMSLFGIKMIIW